MTVSKKYAADLNFNDAIEQSILAAQESGYKDISVTTENGTIVGEYVQKTNEVLILKEETGITHSKTGKEKVELSFIKLDTIIAISVYILE
ncbi:hypothetical protein [Psychromonas algicola]|uniref:hypothetical protein n=1 Tax=Psychromonas algicola TaxID=2555642 RepID=UPI00106809C2|nr:hypothetical protein [Psychromonas sp. RZ5]TEW51488.1 hypothetical protein E2R67_06885 [Psychromonas sp. RZ5]